MENIRLKKIAAQYQHILSQILLDEIEAPALKGVSVSHVLITPDLSIARIYFHQGGSVASPEDILQEFHKCQGFLRRSLATRVSIKYTPRLEFFYDESLELVDHIDALFKQVEQQKSSS